MSPVGGTSAEGLCAEDLLLVMVDELREGDTLGWYRSDCDGSSALVLLWDEMRSLVILVNECLRVLTEVNIIALRVICLSVLAEESRVPGLVSPTVVLLVVCAESTDILARTYCGFHSKICTHESFIFKPSRGFSAEHCH